MAQRIADDSSDGPGDGAHCDGDQCGTPTSEALTVPATVTSAKPKASNHKYFL